MALRPPSRAGVLVLAFLVLLPSAALAASQLVTIQSFAFAPPATTINVGESVTWTNRDPVTHTATADDGSFNTGMLAPGASATIKLTVAGTFGYHCAIHPTMKGAVTVAAPAPAPTPQPTPAPTAPPPAATPPPAPIVTPSPSPSTSPSPTASPAPSASPTAAPTAARTITVTTPSAAPGPGRDLGGGPGTALAIGGLVLAAGLGGVALYLYRRRE